MRRRGHSLLLLRPLASFQVIERFLPGRMSRYYTRSEGSAHVEWKLSSMNLGEGASVSVVIVQREVEEERPLMRSARRQAICHSCHQGRCRNKDVQEGSSRQLVTPGGEKAV